MKNSGDIVYIGAKSEKELNGTTVLSLVGEEGQRHQAPSEVAMVNLEPATPKCDTVKVT
jgi:hypothetical protein